MTAVIIPFPTRPWPHPVIVVMPPRDAAVENLTKLYGQARAGDRAAVAHIQNIATYGRTVEVARLAGMLLHDLGVKGAIRDVVAPCDVEPEPAA